MKNHKLSERKVCRLLEFPRNTMRYQHRESSDKELEQRLKQLARKHIRYGYRKLYNILRNDGIIVNHKKIYRIYKELGLNLKRKKSKKMRFIRSPQTLLCTKANQHWSIDFMSDSLANGRRLRYFNVVDNFTRECLAIEVNTSMPTLLVIRILENIIKQRGKPEKIICDNGPEFRSSKFQRWCEKNKIYLHFIQPGKPMQNAFVESFNGKFRNECLDINTPETLKEAKHMSLDYKTEHNELRPHSSLKGLTPKMFIASLSSENPMGFSDDKQNNKDINNMAA